jgi:tRNA U34 5-methylaminomethyl-2-thiouridine-forming methyltransferase MnmC
MAPFKKQSMYLVKTAYLYLKDKIISILEIGFGTGLNTITYLRVRVESTNEYVGVEAYL